ncbi:unnamed protein product [Closterium sp. NIES-65]|nr:unnamed protein product [Closterium sp. NIES-65]
MAASGGNFSWAGNSKRVTADAAGVTLPHPLSNLNLLDLSALSQLDDDVLTQEIKRLAVLPTLALASEDLNNAAGGVACSAPEAAPLAGGVGCSAREAAPLAGGVGYSAREAAPLAGGGGCSAREAAPLAGGVGCSAREAAPLAGGVGCSAREAAPLAGGVVCSAPEAATRAFPAPASAVGVYAMGPMMTAVMEAAEERGAIPFGDFGIEACSDDDELNDDDADDAVVAGAHHFKEARQLEAQLRDLQNTVSVLQAQLQEARTKIKTVEAERGRLKVQLESMQRQLSAEVAGTSTDMDAVPDPSDPHVRMENVRKDGALNPIIPSSLSSDDAFDEMVGKTFAWLITLAPAGDMEFYPLWEEFQPHLVRKYIAEGTAQDENYLFMGGNNKRIERALKVIGCKRANMNKPIKLWAWGAGGVINKEKWFLLNVGGIIPTQARDEKEWVEKFKHREYSVRLKPPHLDGML